MYDSWVMASVLHFRRQLDAPPAARDLPEITIRHIHVPDDIAAWLALRNGAMAGQKPPVRPWTQGDFAAEMSDKPWWNPQCTWLAIAGERGSPAIDVRDQVGVVGAVTLALREGAAGTVPVVHWLLVDPDFRRRGIGRLLMSNLERAAWDAGWREVQLETHAGWREAVAFYHSMGYAPVRERSPR
jgi:GNAT superfamily N-acetyltransferase